LFNIFKGKILYFEGISPEKYIFKKKNYPPVFGRKTLLVAVIKCTVKGSNHCGEFAGRSEANLINIG